MSMQFSKTLFLARQCEQHQLTQYARTRCLSSLSMDLHQPCRASQTRYLSPRAQRFSSATQRQASPPSKKGKQAPKGGMMEKMRAAMKQAEREGGLPEDVGYQAQFIMPTGKNLPSGFRNRRGRMMLLKKRLKDFMTVVGFGLWYRFFYLKPRPRLRIFQIAPTAEKMHRQMYEHFAAGNLTPIEPQLFSGMMGSLRARIAQRPAGTHLKWTLHKYLSKSKLVDWRPIMFPRMPGEKSTERKGLVQAIVRIHSTQSLQHVRLRTRANGESMEVLVDSQGRELASQDPKLAEQGAKELVEYIVLQKVVRNSREGPWKVQGFAEESSLEKLEREEGGGRSRRAQPAAAA